MTLAIWALTSRTRFSWFNLKRSTAMRCEAIRLTATTGQALNRVKFAAVNVGTFWARHLKSPQYQSLSSSGTAPRCRVRALFCCGGCLVRTSPTLMARCIPSNCGCRGEEIFFSKIGQTEEAFLKP